MSQASQPVKASFARRNQRRLILGGVILGIAALSYAWYDYRFPSWKEEVQLPDGRMIVVKQRRDFIEGYGTRKTWLTFSLPEMGGEQTWVEHMQPILLAVSKTGQVFVVGWPSGFKQMSMYRLPKYGYVAYQWKGAAFQRVPFLSVPEELRLQENLIRCTPKRRHVNWETKLAWGCDNNSDYVLGESRRIDLTKMQDWALKDAQLRNTLPQSD
jgi:hypothetical protein